MGWNWVLDTFHSGRNDCHLPPATCHGCANNHLVHGTFLNSSILVVVIQAQTLQMLRVRAYVHEPGQLLQHLSCPCAFQAWLKSCL